MRDALLHSFRDARVLRALGCIDGKTRRGAVDLYSHFGKTRRGAGDLHSHLNFSPCASFVELCLISEMKRRSSRLVTKSDDSKRPLTADGDGISFDVFPLDITRLLLMMLPSDDLRQLRATCKLMLRECWRALKPRLMAFPMKNGSLVLIDYFDRSSDCIGVGGRTDCYGRKETPHFLSEGKQLSGLIQFVVPHIGECKCLAYSTKYDLLFVALPSDSFEDESCIVKAFRLPSGECAFTVPAPNRPNPFWTSEGHFFPDGRFVVGGYRGYSLVDHFGNVENVAQLHYHGCQGIQTINGHLFFGADDSQMHMWSASGVGQALGLYEGSIALLEDAGVVVVQEHARPDVINIFDAETGKFQASLKLSSKRDVFLSFNKRGILVENEWKDRLRRRTVGAY